MSNQELIITELVFENVLTGLHPTEIAAVLSCVVFEQKHCSKPELAPSLLEVNTSCQPAPNLIGHLVSGEISCCIQH